MTKKRLRAITVCAASLACLGFTANAEAARFCPRPREAIALKTAAVQQELMVAALSCHQSHLYNRFVLTYRDELQRSDAVLRRYFTHRRGSRGMAGYHAYKTKLANAASLRSLHDIGRYCAEAREIFRDALESDRVTLARLVADRPSGAAASCHVNVAEAWR